MFSNDFKLDYYTLLPKYYYAYQYYFLKYVIFYNVVLSLTLPDSDIITLHITSSCLTRFYYIITIFFYNTNAYEIY